MAGRTYKTEAVVLRSFRFGEADRVLHLYTLARGRVGAVAKGIRKKKSRSLQFQANENNTATPARAFQALTRFLELLDELPAHDGRASLDPLALSFQLKLLWLSGYLPHLTSCADCGAQGEPLIGYSPAAGGAVCAACGTGALALSPAGIAGIETLLARPLAEATAAGLTDRSTRDALTVITAAYEYFGNFRLRTLRSA